MLQNWVISSGRAVLQRFEIGGRRMVDISTIGTPDAPVNHNLRSYPIEPQLAGKAHHLIPKVIPTPGFKHRGIAALQHVRLSTVL
jgi:hypothetical protein